MIIFVVCLAISCGVLAEDSIICSNEPLSDVLTMNDLIKLDTPKDSNNLLILLSSRGSTIDLDRDLANLLNFNYFKSSNVNCALLLELLKDCNQNAPIKFANSLADLSAGLSILQLPLNLNTVNDIGHFVNAIKTTQSVKLVVTQCKLPTAEILLSAAAAFEQNASKIGLQASLRATPIIVQQLGVFALFLFFLCVGLSWTMDIRVPVCLLNPDLNLKRS